MSTLVIEKQISDLEDKLAKSKKRKLIKCDTCGKKTSVGNIVYIQTHFYIAPYSCTGGDYWKPGEGQYECPKCLSINRLYKRKCIESMKYYFKDIKKTYHESIW